MAKGRSGFTTEKLKNLLSQLQPNIEVVGEYVSMKTKIKVRCCVDWYVWEQNPYRLLKGIGCPKCAGNLKISEEQFIAMVSSSPHTQYLDVIGSYVNNKTKIKVRCRKDGEEWYATPKYILNGKSHCPMCSNRAEKVAEAQIRLNLKQGTHIEGDFSKWGNFLTISHPCGHVEHRTVKSVSINPDCMRCIGKGKLSDEEVSEKARSLGLEVLGRWSDRVKLFCPKHKHEWVGFTNNLIRGTGCMKCSGKYQPNTEEFIEKVKQLSLDVEVIGEYVTAKTKMQFRCNKHNFIFSKTPNNLLRGSGCPKCCKRGFNESKPSNFYIYLFNGYLGFGITSNLKRRRREHEKSFTKSGVSFELYLNLSMTGTSAKRLESEIKRIVPIHNSGVTGFKYEATVDTNKDFVLNCISEFFVKDNYDK